MLNKSYGERSRTLMFPDQMKVCSRCQERKLLRTDFYMCSGRYRSECKKCSSKFAVIRQRETEAWKTRFATHEERKSYANQYYAKNKDKFAEYRRRFKERHPDYYKKNKEKQHEE